MDPRQILKTNAAKKAVEYIKPGMCIGLGSGSTSEIALKMIAEIAGEMNLTGIPSSEKIANLAISYGIPVKDHSQVEYLDLNIDGADEVDKNFQMIKGGGGALLREKINATHSRKNIIIVDESKLVDSLGKFPLPIEVNTFGQELVLKEIKKKYGIDVKLRSIKGNQFITDNDNLIIDCSFDKIEEPAKLEAELMMIPGVLETGLFLDLVDVLIVGKQDGVEVFQRTE